METADRMLGCRTCGKDFLFTVREQEFFTSKGFDEPRHCPECRAERKREKSGGGSPSQGPVQTPHTHSSGGWSEVTCAACGKPATVPFKPTSGRPVFCRDCFSSHRVIENARPSTPSIPKSQGAPARPLAAQKQSAPLHVPQHILEDDMGPLPDIDPAPDEEGEITVAEFVPMGGNFGATSEEIDPQFDDGQSKRDQ